MTCPHFSKAGSTHKRGTKCHIYNFTDGVLVTAAGFNDDLIVLGINIDAGALLTWISNCYLHARENKCQTQK